MRGWVEVDIEREVACSAGEDEAGRSGDGLLVVSHRRDELVGGESAACGVAQLSEICGEAQVSRERSDALGERGVLEEARRGGRL